MTSADTDLSPPELTAERSPDGTLTLTLQGRLNFSTTPVVWRKALEAWGRGVPSRLVLDLGGVSYCDSSGIGLLIDLRQLQEAQKVPFELRALRDDVRRLYELFGDRSFGEPASRRSRTGLIQETGRAAREFLRNVAALVSFVGEIGVELWELPFRRRRLRWKDALWVAETAGANAIAIIAWVGFLMGFILAYQSAMPMRRYGADMFLPNLVALTMLRELGPLMTAIILAGRSGSAFAAEIGTMKVNEEVDALSTMGLSPLRFLALPKVAAGIVVTPLLTILCNLSGLAGGGVVFGSLGYPPVTYVNQMLRAVNSGDLLSGLSKSLVFGVLVAGIGSLRGLQTRQGPRAVGESTTRAVVSGIVLILVADGVFAIIFYYLGI